jgi:hypothetical protein
LLALSASERMVMSVGPPAGKAMISLIGLVGKACAQGREGGSDQRGGGAQLDNDGTAFHAAFS